MLRAIGMALVVAGASGTGFLMAWSVRRAAAVLEQLLSAMELMRNEIACRQTPLPVLMRHLQGAISGSAADFFGRTASELERRQAGSVSSVFRRQASNTPAFSPGVRQVLLQLGAGLGQYDAASQLRSVELAEARLRSQLEILRSQQQGRVKSYCTLGVCAGLALAILAL